MALINGQTSIEALDSQDLIIEAVFENMDLKKIFSNNWMEYVKKVLSWLQTLLH